MGVDELQTFLPISTAASMVGAMTERLSADDIVDLARDNLRSPGPDRDAAYKKLIEENDVAFGVCRSN